MPFSFLNTVTTWFLKKRMHQIELFKKYPLEVQNEVLISLLKSAKNTEFGIKYNFNSINNYSSFSKNIPLTDYESFFKYIERSIKGESNIFWNSPIKWYAQSSGTTNSKSKFIPVSKESLEECHYKAGKDVLCLYVNNNENSNLFSGKLLRLGGSKKLYENNNNYFGDLSAILIDNLPLWAELLSAPSNEISLMDKWDEKIKAIINSTLNENITSLAGVPSWMLILLNKILEDRNERTIKDIWKNLEVYFHGGVNFNPYINQFKSVLGEDVRFYETYNASEGFFAIQDRNGSDDMLLMLDYGIYFEFEILNKLNHEIINLSKVKLDTNYAIIISTNAGLWRYKIGDTVKFTSLNPFRIKITGRTKSFINAFGEELIIENAENALNKTLSKHKSRIVEYTVAPSFISKKNSGYHQWLIEFEKKPLNISKFCEDLDSNLQELNSDYKSKRFKDITMKRLEIIIAKEKLFFDWLRLKNKLGGQNKIPRLSNDRVIIEELIKLN
ncbi:GH3 auxin-responsive promoter family protein [Flavobacteriaceae bacterium]|nr:GH3 auxin-responsive promoter family protein [Flavobacteriaceae bacterium]MDA9977656.1 GH3 auxin-responsive promoter family protein [Flavobacteriaceae bacterium]MDB4024056.1 GH3 auxin-responsive promoter family protein [Flavobacteriaceae bacterium]MDB9827595.1 GH3 auxin-responsive promoter family protein [Flavobacteriaceae bacterium]MDC0592666.1 GH3 auxin-responsive promoter family protein [Flavobacteriaceae bacterium]